MICTDPRHDTPCPGPCRACREECNPKFLIDTGPRPLKTSSVDSKSHLTIRAGRRTKKGKGQGWGLSVTNKQLDAHRKAARNAK